MTQLCVHLVAGRSNFSICSKCCRNLHVDYHLIFYQLSSRLVVCTFIYIYILVSTTRKIISNILLSRLTAYIDEIIGDLQWGFWHKGASTDQIFCICGVWEKNREYISTSSKPIIQSVREVLYNILIESDISMKLIPYSIVLHEKLIVTWTVKFPALYGTQMFTLFTGAHHSSLSWDGWIYSTPSHSISVRSILILSSHLYLDLPLGFCPYLWK